METKYPQRNATLPDVHVPDSFHAKLSPPTQVALTPSVNPDPLPLPVLEEAPPSPPLQRENTDTRNVTDMMEEINRINRHLKPLKARPTAEPTNKTTDASSTPTLRRSERLRAKRDTFLAKVSPVAAFHQCDLHQGFFNTPNPYAGKAAKPNTNPNILTWEEAM